MTVDKEKAPAVKAEAINDKLNATAIVKDIAAKGAKAKQSPNVNPIKSGLENREKLEPGMSFLDYVAGIVDMTKGKDLKARIREQAAQLEAGGLTDKSTATALLWAIRKTFEQEDKEAPPWLADVDPWPEDVSIKDVITEIEELVRQVVYCAPETARAIAYFIAVTWFAESLPEVAPYALITSAQKRCGKSTLMALMGELVFHPLLASNLSPPSLFRAVDAYHPTLLLDECDTYLGTDPDLIGMINCGYKRPLAKVMRCEGDNHDLRQFDCFGPKVMAGINAEKKSGTVADRSIVLRLERRPAEAKRLARLYEVKNKAPAKIPTLMRKLARLAEKHAEEMKHASPDMPESLNDRACEIWAPLIALADLESKEEGKRLRDVALTVSEHAPQTEDWGLELLGDIKDLLTQIAESPSGTGVEVGLAGAAVRVQITTDRGRDFIGARNLQQGLTANLELRWPTFDHGKPITAHRVTSKLKSYGVVTVKIKALGNCIAYALDGENGLRKAIETYGPDAEK